MSGKLMPLPALRFAPPGRTSVTTSSIVSESVRRMVPPILPSSSHTRSPGLRLVEHFGKGAADAGGCRRRSAPAWHERAGQDEQVTGVDSMGLLDLRAGTRPSPASSSCPVGPAETSSSPEVTYVVSCRTRHTTIGARLDLSHIPVSLRASTFDEVEAVTDFWRRR